MSNENVNKFVIDTTGILSQDDIEVLEVLPHKSKQKFDRKTESPEVEYIGISNPGFTSLWESPSGKVYNPASVNKTPTPQGTSDQYSRPKLKPEYYYNLDPNVPLLDQSVQFKVERGVEGPGDICKGANTSKVTCFNCLGPHMISSCQLPLDSKFIARNSRNFRNNQSKKQTSTRYMGNELENSNIKPGIVSDKLRAAIGLCSGQLPLHIYKMREFGYPPGYLKMAKISRSGLTFNDGGNGNDHYIDPGYDRNQFHRYPGFNSPVPDGVIDESRRTGFRPYSHSQNVDIYFKKMQVQSAAESAQQRTINRKREMESRSKRAEERAKRIRRDTNYSPSLLEGDDSEDVPLSKQDHQMGRELASPYQRTESRHQNANFGYASRFDENQSPRFLRNPAFRPQSQLTNPLTAERTPAPKGSAEPPSQRTPSLLSGHSRNAYEALVCQQSQSQSRTTSRPGDISSMLSTYNVRTPSPPLLSGMNVLGLETRLPTRPGLNELKVQEFSYATPISVACDGSEDGEIIEIVGDIKANKIDPEVVTIDDEVEDGICISDKTESQLATQKMDLEEGSQKSLRNDVLSTSSESGKLYIDLDYRRPSSSNESLSQDLSSSADSHRLIIDLDYRRPSTSNDSSSQDLLNKSENSDPLVIDFDVLRNKYSLSQELSTTSEESNCEQQVIDSDLHSDSTSELDYGRLSSSQESSSQKLSNSTVSSDRSVIDLNVPSFPSSIELSQEMNTSTEVNMICLGSKTSCLPSIEDFDNDEVMNINEITLSPELNLSAGIGDSTIKAEDSNESTMNKDIETGDSDVNSPKENAESEEYSNKFTKLPGMNKFSKGMMELLLCEPEPPTGRLDAVLSILKKRKFKELGPKTKPRN